MKKQLSFRPEFVVVLEKKSAKSQGLTLFSIGIEMEQFKLKFINYITFV